MKPILFNQFLILQFEKLSAIKSPETPLDDNQVHRMRVATKRMRACLNLYQHLIDKDDVKVKNLYGLLKQLSELLAANRSYSVNRKLCDTLIEEYHSSDLKKILVTLKELAFPGNQPPVIDWLAVEAIVEKMGKSLMQLPSADTSLDHVSHFMEKRFDKVCRTRNQVFHKSESDELHQYRKKIKRLLYQNELLPEKQRDNLFLSADVKVVADKLGEIHDLDCFEDKLNLVCNDFEKQIVNQIYQTLSAKRQTLLQECQQLMDKIC